MATGQATCLLLELAQVSDRFEVANHRYTLHTIRDPRHLDDAAKRALFVDGGLTVAMKAFAETEETVTAESSASHFRHMFDGDILSVVVDDDTSAQVARALFMMEELLPHGSTADPPITLPYISGVLVVPEHQGRGLLRRLLGHVLGQHPEWQFLACRTQNPRLLLGLQHFGTVYPLEAPPADIQHFAQQLATRLGHHPEQYSPSTMVVHCGFPDFLVRITPTAGDDRVRQVMCLYDQPAGDGVLALCRLHQRDSSST
eukprot:GGOE01044252.1.p2 GENE.GGOE01044252.1~~GGOE01044252.1.p2  ORF type:complete len:271 (+),score=77.37 GGOE01044252.1:40-813(+)